MISESFVELKVGDVVKATVKEVLKTYAILFIGDTMACLPASELSWKRGNNLIDLLHRGEELQAVVIQISDQGVMLSIKRMTKDPWSNVESLCHVNQQTHGVVTHILKFGAILELSNGIQGLLHKKEMLTDGLKNPNEVVVKGQELDVIITSINKEERKMSFSIKSLEYKSDEI